MKCVKTLIIVVLLLSLGLLPVNANAAEKVQLRFQTWHLGEEPWRSVLEEMKKDFEENNPDIEIVFERVTYGDKEMIFTTQSEARAAADHVHFSYRPIQNFAEQGYLLDLTPFIEKEGPDFLDEFLPSPLAMGTIDGRIYALPDNFDPMVLIYNARLFEEAGLDPDRPPRTRTEFLEYAKKLTRDTNGDGRIDQWGFALMGARQEGLFMRFNPWFWGSGAQYLTEDNKSSALNTPEALDGVRFYTELHTKHGVVPPAPIETGAQEARIQMANRQVAMMVGFAPTPNILKNLNPEMDVYKELKMAPIPSGDIKATAAWISFRVISTHTKHPEEAWRLYKYVHSFENQLRWFHGAGVLSSRKDVRFSEPIMNDPFALVMAEQAEYVKYEPLIPEWTEIGDLMITAIQDILSGRKNEEKALADTHDAINEILSRR
ncbi:Maltodextrin-binding protein MdxE [subsurface metagenome]|nr:extracellular solute-binding protein [Clostridia bacterium]